MPARALSSTARPNESQFVSDLTNLFRRHHVRCGEPKDLEQLPFELESNGRLCADLFLLCTAISHMGESDLSPEDLLSLIARAVAGPRGSDGTSPNIPEATRASFLGRYAEWTARVSQLTPATPADDESADAWPRAKTPFIQAASLARNALSAAGERPAQARVTPDRAIGDLTLRELNTYLVDLERRVKHAEAVLLPGPTAASVPPLPGPAAVELPQASSPRQSAKPAVERLPTVAPVRADKAPAPPTDSAEPRESEAVQPPKNVLARGYPRLGYAFGTRAYFYAETAPAQAPATPAAAAPAPTTPAPAAPARFDAPAVQPELQFTRRDKLHDRPVRLNVLPSLASFALLAGLAAGYEYFYRDWQDVPAMAVKPHIRVEDLLPKTNDRAASAIPHAPPKAAAAGSNLTAAARRSVLAERPNAPTRAWNQPAAATAGTILDGRTEVLAREPQPSSPEPAAASSVPAEDATQSAPIVRAAPVLPATAPPRQIIEPYTQRSYPDVVPIERVPAPASSQAAVSTRERFPAGVGRPASGAATQTLVTVPSSILMRYALQTPQPRYPMNRHVDINTSVVVRATVSKEGRVLSAVAGSGADDLRAAAEQAVLQWRFRPYLVDGSPADVVTQITFVFKAE